MTADLPAVTVAGFGDADVMIAGHCLTGRWFQVLSHAEARALAADIIAATT